MSAGADNPRLLAGRCSKGYHTGVRPGTTTSPPGVHSAPTARCSALREPRCALAVFCLLFALARLSPCADTSPERLFRIVHITDTHCSTTTRVPAGKPTRGQPLSLGGIKTVHWKDLPHSFQILEETVGWVNEKIEPDLVLVTGDITNGDAPLADMEKAKQILDKLKCAYYPCKGNHDAKESYDRVFGKRNYSVEYKGWRFIVFTDCPTAEDVKWLRNEAGKAPAKPLIFCTHYLVYCDPIVRTGIRLARNLEVVMHRAEEVDAVLREQRTFVLAISGHVHSPFFFQADEAAPGYLTTDSLCEPPHEFRVLDVYPDRIETWFVRGNSFEDICEGKWEEVARKSILRGRLRGIRGQ